MKPEEFSTQFIQIMEKMIDVAESNKVLHSDPKTARHWAIFKTELEKLSAFYQTYLSDSKGDS